MVAVWTAEALNTALEFLTDVAAGTFIRSLATPRMAAGAVPIAAMGSRLIGLWFWPHAPGGAGPCNEPARSR